MFKNITGNDIHRHRIYIIFIFIFFDFGLWIVDFTNPGFSVVHQQTDENLFTVLALVALFKSAQVKKVQKGQKGQLL